MRALNEIMLDPPEDGQIIDPAGWFESPGPFEIEIGCGKGGFLLSRAKANPTIRMLGIEWANKYFKYCADRMARWGLTNVRVMRTDARHFIIHHLPPNSVSVLHVYHPDPWPKKRHHKRRLFNQAFVDAGAMALVPGGLWRVQSDDRAYFEAIRELLDAHAELQARPFEETGAKPDTDWKGTNFEIKYVREGRTIYRVAYVAV